MLRAWIASAVRTVPQQASGRLGVQIACAAYLQLLSYHELGIQLYFTLVNHAKTPGNMRSPKDASLPF